MPFNLSKLIWFTDANERVNAHAIHIAALFTDMHSIMYSAASNVFVLLLLRNAGVGFDGLAFSARIKMKVVD